MSRLHTTLLSIGLVMVSALSAATTIPFDNIKTDLTSQGISLNYASLTTAGDLISALEVEAAPGLELKHALWREWFPALSDSKKGDRTNTPSVDYRTATREGYARLDPTLSVSQKKAEKYCYFNEASLSSKIANLYIDEKIADPGVRDDLKSQVCGLSRTLTFITLPMIRVAVEHINVMLANGPVDWVTLASDALADTTWFSHGAGHERVTCMLRILLDISHHIGTSDAPLREDTINWKF